MPILVVVMAIAAVVGATGAAAGVHGGTKIVSAHDKEDSAKKRHEDNLVMPKDCRYLAVTAMNDLGKLELGALESFGPFVDIVTKLQNVPTFDDLNQAKLDIPEFSQEDLREVAVGAKAALGGIAGAAVGTAGGIAAAGATTTIIGALGTASTGTEIASLNGVAVTNAILAWLGGGSLAAGGGGTAVGSAVLGMATAGAAVLVAGAVIDFMGHKLNESTEELSRQVDEEEKEINEACDLLSDIRLAAIKYSNSIKVVKGSYEDLLRQVSTIVNDEGKTDWKLFTDKDKLLFQNMVLLVGLLYKMYGVNLVIDDDGDGSAVRVNHDGVNSAIDQSEDINRKIGEHDS